MLRKTHWVQAILRVFYFLLFFTSRFLSTSHVLKCYYFFHSSMTQWILLFEPFFYINAFHFLTGDNFALPEFVSLLCFRIWQKYRELYNYGLNGKNVPKIEVNSKRWKLEISQHFWDRFEVIRVFHRLCGIST